MSLRQASGIGMSVSDWVHGEGNQGALRKARGASQRAIKQEKARREDQSEADRKRYEEAKRKIPVVRDWTPPVISEETAREVARQAALKATW